jgi:penicillin-binding protein 2
VSWNHKLGIVHGAINVVQAIALSNDIFFYWIGGGYPQADFEGLDKDGWLSGRLVSAMGKPTGIDLPGEVEAIIPDDQWKRQLYAESWTTGDSYNMAIGQGYVLSTPLQVLVSTAAVANGGPSTSRRSSTKSWILPVDCSGTSSRMR